MSFVVPTKDSAATLERCLESIREQRDAAVEIVVVDNHSTDATIEIARRFADEVIVAGPERSRQRNLGAARARGPILVFVDSDMTVPDTLAAEVVGVFERSEDARAVVIPERGEGSGYWASCRTLEKRLYVGDPTVEAARAFRRSAFASVEGFDEELHAGEDWDLARRVDPGGAATRRVEATIVHDEGRMRLREDLRTKHYYGRSLGRYFSKHRDDVVAKLFRRSLIGHRSEIVADPFHALGLLVLKVLELCAVISGMVVARVEPLGARWRSIDPARRALIKTYAIPATLALLATQAWFAAGRFIASGDVTPFVRTNLSPELAGIWGHTLTGAGSPTFQSAARMPELATLGAAHLLRLSDPVAQRIFYSVLTVAVVLAATRFVLLFVNPGFAAGAAGALALFNPFVLQHLPNPLPLWTIGLMAAFATLVVSASRADVPVAPFALLSLGLGYVALNPPLLAIVLVWIVVVARLAHQLTSDGSRHRVFIYLLRAAPWVALVNLWWVVPFALTVSGAGTGFGIGAQTDVQAWAWTQARLSIPNVLTLSGHWGWVHPEYFPFAPALDRAPWGMLKFALPALAFLAPAFAPREKRRAALVLAMIVAALVFLGKGIHPPGAAVNLFLYRHVPGMWLLREPLSKVGPAILLCYLPLIALTVDGARRLGADWPGLAGRWTRTVPTALALAALAYPIPLWDGAVIPDQRAVLPSAHVVIPDGWRELASVVNTSQEPGKVLVVPLDDYYQMPTTWGYYGSDSIPRSLLERPTIQPLPGGYYTDLSQYASLVHGVQTALVNGDAQAVPGLLQSLGVRFVVVRDDIDPTFPHRPMPDPTPMERTLGAVSGVTQAGEFGVAHLFSFDEAGAPAGSGAPLRTYGSAIIGSGEPGGDLPLLLGSAPGSVVVSRAPTGAVTAPAGVVGPGETASIDLNAGPVALMPRATDPEIYHVTQAGREVHVLHLEPLTRVELDGRTLLRREAPKMRVGRQTAAAIGTGGVIEPLTGAGATIALTSSSALDVYRAEPAGVSGARLLDPGDCNRYDGRTLKQAGISASALGPTAASGVRLEASAHSACVTAPITGIDPVGQSTPDLVRLQYRTLAGRPARVCVWQVGPDSCAVVPPLVSSPTWQDYVAAFTPEPGTTALRLVLYADAEPSGSGTVTEYRSLSAERLSLIGTHTINVGLPAQRTVDASVGSHQVSIPGLLVSSLGAPPSPVGDCHAYDQRTMRQAGIETTPLPGFGVRLQASAHSACVSLPVEHFVPNAAYALQMQYRTLTGRPARVCVWQEGPDRCASLPPLSSAAAGPEWHTYRATFTAQPGTAGARLFLYADGGSSGDQTITDFRDLRLEVAPSLGVALLPSSPDQEPAPFVASRQDGHGYDVELSAASRPFLLTLGESYASGWKLEGLPPGRTATHVAVDGYANGWWISPGPPMSLTISYAPDEWERRACIGSIAGLLVLLFAASRRRRHRVEADAPSE